MIFILGRRLVGAYFLVASFSTIACSPPEKVDPLVDRLRDAKNVFLAQVQKVEFKTVLGANDKRGVLWVVGHDKQPSKSVWWDGVATMGPVFRGHPPSTLSFRFNSNWCGGVEFRPGDWYLFVLGDLPGMIVVTDRDWEAIRHFGNYDLPVVFEQANFNPITSLIETALATPTKESIERLRRWSSGVGGDPPPPEPQK
ncbi:MAG: hypothetical protein JSS42_13680 [Proteobacteria bacterium]|nr:hypothetical protein [Pseudomonadota bacterium]